MVFLAEAHHGVACSSGLGYAPGRYCMDLDIAFNTPGSHWSYVAVGMLTALAAVLVGFFTGFLIGVPRVVSSGQARLSKDTFSPSTNLAEISHWLTKLLRKYSEVG